LSILLDRDVRRGRSTVYTLRMAWFLGLVVAGLEIFASDLQDQAWYPAVRSIVPLFFGATLFLGFWLHARVVAFVCPDPPDCEEPTAASWLLSTSQWFVQLPSRLKNYIFKRRISAAAEVEAAAKPKRRTKKAVDAEEDATPKRKRKAPVKRVSKPRATTKIVEEEEIDDDSYPDDSDELDESSDTYEESEASSDTGNEWDEDESEVEAPPPPVRQSRTANSNPPIPTQPRQSAAPAWQQRPAQPSRASQMQMESQDESDSDDNEIEDGDSSYRVDDGLTADQLRGLSKRQKRELRQKIKDQQRNVKR